MKYPLTWFLAAAVAAALVWTVLSRKASVHQAQTEALRSQLEQKSQEVEALQAANEGAERQRQDMARLADNLASQLSAREPGASNSAPAVPPAPPQLVPQPQAAPPAPSSNPENSPDSQPGFGKLISKMFSDPDTKQVIRASQRMTVDQLYTPLIRKMALTPDEATQFKDLLTDNLMSAGEKAATLMGGSASTNRVEALSSLAAEQQSFDDRLKTFLGDTRYAQYKAYQETSNERQQLLAFAQQSGNERPLTEPQTEALLAIMKEERQNVAVTGVGSANTGNEADFAASLSENKVNELIQSQQISGQRVYERARTILSPEQLQAFGSFQTNQLQSMRASVNMFRKMFAPDNAAGSAIPNP
jgi:hypothetical protein